MKAFLPVVLLALAAVCSGCVPRYTITLNNNNVITARGKPKYDSTTSTYRYTDSNGRENAVAAVRVKEIAPR